MYWDPHYVLYVALPLLGLSLLVQLYLKSTYAHYSQVESRRGLTGAEAAERILSQAGIRDVRVEQVEGFLSDHYDPRHKVLRLSPRNYSGRSISSLGVAAHEAGHAIQHAQSYALLKLRNLAVPVANLGSNLGLVVIVIGLATHSTPLAMVGFVLIFGILVFELVNLPVEFDASKRALQILPESGILTVEETRGAQKVLGAAALTYVAAMIATLWTLIYYAFRLGLLGRRSND
ncbi:MAG: zinc metallopeptidase [Thermoanaerobaculia bacterium]